MRACGIISRVITRQRAAFVFIFITVLLDMVAFGVIIPVFPQLILQLQGGDMAGAAAIFGIFGTAFAVMQFIFAPVQGALADRYGRRPVILLSNLGLGVDFIVMALHRTAHLRRDGCVLQHFRRICRGRDAA